MSNETIHQAMHQEALKAAERSVYSMNNNYLTEMQKVLVECWYQLPIALFSYVFLVSMAMTLGTPGGLWNSLVLAMTVSFAYGLFNWVVHPRALLLAFGVLLGWVETLINLGFAGYFIYKGAWLPAGLAAASAFGLLCLLAPSMWLYGALGRGMHPKYRFAKKQFGITFPFE